ncbi:MAG: helix-turn-helix domain-containing protein [Erysipelotrichaceae bacterium]|nr:helix-turn-helix domain-containing protein [Erysipelotrichaceae bacterium]
MKLVSLKIIKNGIHGNPSPRDFHLYYVLKGNAQIEEGNNVLPLDAEEMLVINPGESVTLKCENGTVLECRISHSEVLRLMGYQRKVIVCNTHLVKNENTDELRRVLGSLVRSYYEPDQNLIEREQYSLSLVYLLIAHFSNNVFEENDESRKNEIASYIEANYADEVTLEMIADEFGLTPQYFSRYFSNVFRTSFLKYLNHVRLEHAVDDLLNTKETVLRIAVNHGFANVASFNREFQNVYHTTPGSYRQKHGSEQEKIEKDDILSILNEKADENGDDTVRIDVHMEGSYPPLKKILDGNPELRKL